MVALPLLVFAQPVNPQKDPDKPVPITGIEILLVAGAAYGAHRYLRGRNCSR